MAEAAKFKISAAKIRITMSKMGFYVLIGTFPKVFYSVNLFKK